VESAGIPCAALGWIEEVGCSWARDQAATGLGKAVLHCFWCNLQAAEDERLMAMKQQIHRSFDKNTGLFLANSWAKGYRFSKMGRWLFEGNHAT
jgi:hypothetical protein